MPFIYKLLNLFQEQWRLQNISFFYILFVICYSCSLKGFIFALSPSLTHVKNTEYQRRIYDHYNFDRKVKKKMKKTHFRQKKGPWIN